MFARQIIHPSAHWSIHPLSHTAHHTNQPSIYYLALYSPNTIHSSIHSHQSNLFIHLSIQHISFIHPYIYQGSHPIYLSIHTSFINRSTHPSIHLPQFHWFIIHPSSIQLSIHSSNIFHHHPYILYPSSHHSSINPSIHPSIYHSYFNNPDIIHSSIHSFILHHCVFSTTRQTSLFFHLILRTNKQLLIIWGCVKWITKGEFTWQTMHAVKNLLHPFRDDHWVGAWLTKMNK